MQWDPRVFEENRDFCLKLGNYVGYHFVLEEAVLPKTFPSSDPLHIALAVAERRRCLPLRAVSCRYCFLDRHDKIVQSQWLAGSTPQTGRREHPGDTARRFTAPPTGTYKLAVGLFLKQGDSRRLIGLEFKVARPTAGMSCTSDWSASDGKPMEHERGLAALAELLAAIEREAIPHAAFWPRDERTPHFRIPITEPKREQARIVLLAWHNYCGKKMGLGIRAPALPLNSGQDNSFI